MKSVVMFGIVAVASVVCAPQVWAAEPVGETAQMRSEIEQLRRELSEVRSAQFQPQYQPPNQERTAEEVLHSVDTGIGRREGTSWDYESCSNACGNPVQTNLGKLTIHGLVQVWYQNIQHDSRGWENGPAVLGASPAPFGNNETRGNSTFRVRRAYMDFDYCLDENISSHVRIDPAAQALGFPGVPSNQAPFYNAGFATSQTAAWGSSSMPGVTCANGTLCNSGIGNPLNNIVRNGGCDACNLLQDAYINYHNICWLPYHDIQVGQMRRQLGEEGSRDDGQLDFAERSMITQIAADYDLGAQIHGSFYCGRLQYWAGVFDGAGTAFQSRANRPDDNDSKDGQFTILGRPIWGDDFWGNLEIGGSGLIGNGGTTGGNDPVTNPTAGLNERKTVHSNMYAWAYYAPKACLDGLWLRGEYGRYRDRFAPGVVATGLFNYTNDPAPFHVEGYYGAFGYKFGNDVLGHDHWYSPFEFVARHEAMQNLFYENLSDPNSKLNVSWTTVNTVGFNYYIKGHNAKIQVDSNLVSSQHNGNGGDRQVRDVKNDNLVVSFQVAF